MATRHKQTLEECIQRDGQHVWVRSADLASMYRLLGQRSGSTVTVAFDEIATLALSKHVDYERYPEKDIVAGTVKDWLYYDLLALDRVLQYHGQALGRLFAQLRENGNTNVSLTSTHVELLRGFLSKCRGAGLWHLKDL